MIIPAKSWDYLIITSSNKTQELFYRKQLDLRRKLGLLSGIKQFLVVPDPQGQRIGSGGSTISHLLTTACGLLSKTGKTYWITANVLHWLEAAGQKYPSEHCGLLLGSQ